MSAIKNRYDFVFFFDVVNGNPNGDPAAGGKPRINPQTGHGLVTDVCLKRKIRDYIELVKAEHKNCRIYVQNGSVLNQKHEEAYEALGLESEPFKRPSEEENARAVTAWMCKHFFDIRTFGAVMNTEVNCGYVRGPIQLTFAVSVDPITPMEIEMTRFSVTNVKDQSKERTIGRKFIVPYALYRVEGFVSAALAEKTGFSEEDLNLFWEALLNMFSNDHSAARAKMRARKLYVFRHAKRLGNATEEELFDMIQCRRVTDAPASKFSDYAIAVEGSCPDGVSLGVLL